VFLQEEVPNGIAGLFRIYKLYSVAQRGEAATK